MALEHKLDKVRARKWANIRDAWLAHVPDFNSPGSCPDPGLERLPGLKGIPIPKVDELPIRREDVEGLRRNALWEAVFLFHKCAHTNLAAQRLGERGMRTWSMFNAYHSAYLGAKGIMELLGVALPNIDGKQVLIDLFPETKPLRKKGKHQPVRIDPLYTEFQITRLDGLDQRQLWQAFQRVLRVSSVDVWDEDLGRELKGLSHEKITPPRNWLLYKAHFWPLNDLVADATDEMSGLVGTHLDTDEKGFLLRLCFTVYRLFEQILADLGERSGNVKHEMDHSRCLAAAGLQDMGCYRGFLEQIADANPPQ